MKPYKQQPKSTPTILENFHKLLLHLSLPKFPSIIIHFNRQRSKCFSWRDPEKEISTSMKDCTYANTIQDKKLKNCIATTDVICYIKNTVEFLETFKEFFTVMSAELSLNSFQMLKILNTTINSLSTTKHTLFWTRPIKNASNNELMQTLNCKKK